jgi:hypothetical protein
MSRKSVHAYNSRWVGWRLRATIAEFPDGDAELCENKRYGRQDGLQRTAASAATEKMKPSISTGIRFWAAAMAPEMAAISSPPTAHMTSPGVRSGRCQIMLP